MIKKAVTYIKDVRMEMSKVSWPSRQELLGSTKVVLILSGLLSVFMFGVDTVFNNLIKLLL
ncbi:preprotein translocase subunit SecE [bacterium]|nr:preprotein translocase subunit SecE [FCB group bacterium]MBL7191295.1 preprotein translocase subunit SecE [bacterium]